MKQKPVHFEQLPDTEKNLIAAMESLIQRGIAAEQRDRMAAGELVESRQIPARRSAR